MSNFYCQNCGEKSEEFFEMETSQFRENYNRIKSKNILVCTRCKDCFQKNEENLENILSSKSRHKLIFGGPGTGKTYTFGKILELIPENSNVLVITFINNLVDDLKKKLNRNIEVRTLNSFCKKFLLRKIYKYEYFPELPKLISKDSDLLGHNFKEEDFISSIVNLKKGSKEMEFYIDRSEYYDCVSHDDAVYRVFFYLDNDKSKIPQYSQIVIDEYQDFNLLESSLIELIARKNKIIIAGDDDQALYRFKYASPQFIRKLSGDIQFEIFSLPFCRRCTSVLVNAANVFISKAKKRGLLKDRIKKDFKCYWPDKFLDSKKYPFIFFGKFSADSVISKYIKKRILSIVKAENIYPSEKDEPEFLIVGPPRISHYLKEVNEMLSKDKEIDKNIFNIETRTKHEKFSINDGYKFIKKDNRSNLGWRIVIYKDPLDSSFNKDKNIIYQSLNGDSIIDLLPEEYKNKHEKLANNISLEDTGDLNNPIEKKIKIKLTTYLGAKGLSANHVFVLGLEDSILPKNPNNITDDELCQFIVLLTRARKSLNILSVNKRFNKKFGKRIDNLFSFISMIPPEYLKIKEIKASDL